MADSSPSPSPSATQVESTTQPRQEFLRFDLSQRIEHFIFMLSFTVLAITGLAQKFIDSPLSLAILRAFGGIQSTRQVHHVAAFVMMWVSVYHVISVLYRLYVLRVPWSMLPLIEDLQHLYQDVRYYLGLRKHRAYYGRYNYAEKLEYLAVVWGTIIMGLTGFMMWNPITTTRYLPGEAIPAAKAAHGAEAVLAVLAILIWHSYHVHIKRFNKSMFTGKISREEMEEEHPAELEALESGRAWQRPPAEVIRWRQRLFFPIAVVLTVVLSAGVIGFVSVEPQTAITTVPRGETVAVFVPITPTPPTDTAAHPHCSVGQRSEPRILGREVFRPLPKPLRRLSWAHRGGRVEYGHLRECSQRRQERPRHRAGQTPSQLGGPGTARGQTSRSAHPRRTGTGDCLDPGRGASKIRIEQISRGF